jgi:poly(3-hydroxybutyrate) depolymerase/lysophospholipase L1-like esterase
MLRIVWFSLMIGVAALCVHAQDAQFEELSFEYNGEHYGYRLLTPPHVEAGQRYPLLVFLHGAGERGRDNQVSLKYLPEAMARTPYRDRHPAYVLVPQCRDGQRWVEADWAARRSSRMRPDPSPMMAMAMALVDKTLRTLPIDLDRVYLAGISMGGYGAWELAARRPGTFAAVVPVCGGGDEASAQLLASTPIWAWHGGADNVVWPERTRSMIEAIQRAGGTPKYTELPGVGHMSFVPAFAPGSGVLDWIFEQHRGPERTGGKCPAGAKVLRVLCAGDSNTEAREFPGYRAFLKHDLNERGFYVDFVGSKQGGEPAGNPEHEGYSGEGLARIRQRLREGMIEQHQPDVMVLLAGSNDLWVDVRKDRTPVSVERARELAAQAAAIADEAHRQRPALRVVVGLPATPGNAQVALATYREGLKASAATRPWFALADLEGAANDGVHYWEAGYRTIAERFADAIAGRRVGAPVGSALSPREVRFTEPAAQVGVYDIATVEVDVDGPTALNPFTDVAVSGTFIDAAGKTYKVDGFCDSADGTRFRLRFMPQHSGLVQWSATFQQDGFFTRTAQGSFTAMEKGLRGPVRVDSAHPWHFVYEGSTEHYFYSSTTAYALAGWRDEAIIRESLDRLARLHVTQARVALIPPRVASGAQWMEPAVTTTGWFSFCVNVWPAARPDDVDDPGFNPHRFNVDYWQKYERVLAYARQLGIQVSVIFYVDGRLPGVDPFREPAMGGDLEKLYVRYAAARLAAYSNVFWDVTNEHHLFRTEAWVNEMGAYLRAHDPYAHMTSVHGNGEYPFRKSAWTDFAMYQSWDEHGGYDFLLRSRAKQEAASRPMPQVNEEYGYEDHYPYPWGEARLYPTRSADTRRRLAWQMTMAGGYQTTGERANLPEYGGWVTGRGNAEMVLLGLHQHLYDFWTSLEWWKLDPLKGAGPDNVPCLGLAGETYVFYLEHGGSIPVRLPAGSYAARWYDPRTGLFEDAGVARGAEWATPGAPDSQDWVLLVQRQR